MTHRKFLGVMERFMQLHNERQAARCAQRLCAMQLKARQALLAASHKTTEVLTSLWDMYSITREEVRRSTCCRCPLPLPPAADAARCCCRRPHAAAPLLLTPPAAPAATRHCHARRRRCWLPSVAAAP